MRAEACQLLANLNLREFTGVVADGPVPEEGKHAIFLQVHLVPEELPLQDHRDVLLPHVVDLADQLHQGLCALEVLVDQEPGGLEVQERGEDVEQTAGQDHFVGGLCLVFEGGSDGHRGESADSEAQERQHPNLGIGACAVKLQVDHEKVEGEAVVEGDDHKHAHLLQPAHPREHSHHHHHTADSKDGDDDEVDVVAADVEGEVCEYQHVDELHRFLSVELPLDLSPGEGQLEDAVVDAREEPIEHHDGYQSDLVGSKFLQFGQQVLVFLNSRLSLILHVIITSRHILYTILFFLMERLFCLPKISISEMEEAVRRRGAKQRGYGRDGGAERGNHHQDIQVTSPFYPKDGNRGKCLCQFHRFRRGSPNAHHEHSCRMQENLTPLEARCSHPQSSPQPNQRAKAQRRPTLLQHSSSLLQNLKSLPSVLPEKRTEEPQNLDRQLSVFLPQSKSIPKLPTRKTMKAQKDRIEQVNEASCKIQTLNMEFIKLVSARLSNERFKQKYLKTLFGFIKMKSRNDRSYLINSKAYLHNSLNMLLNHISMDTLVDYEKLSEQQVAQIAYYMNCFPDRVRGVLVDLGRAVHEMEVALAEMRKKREEEQLNKGNDGDMGANGSNGNFRGNNSFPEYESGEINSLATKDSLPNEFDPNNTSITTRAHQEQDTHKLPKEKSSLKRSSSRRTNDLFSSSFSRQIISESQKQKHPEQSIRHSILLTHKSKQNIDKQSLNRTLRSTVLMTVDEIEKEVSPLRKRHTKMKKTRLKSNKTGESEDKYSNIQYDKYISRRSFYNLIGSIERLDQNDMERAHALFKEFKVEYFLDDQQRIQDIIRTFKPLFNEKSLQYFMKQVVVEKDKRMIERLERELDEMLREVKRNDPRHHGEDFFEARAEKKVPACMNKMVKCREIKVDRRDTIDHIKYFQAEEEIQRHRTKEQSVKLHLQQVDLRGVTFATIDPTLSSVLTHSKEPEHYRSTHLPDLPNQKRILQYMRRNHEGTFNYLAEQLRTLCRSLSKQTREQ